MDSKAEPEDLNESRMIAVVGASFGGSLQFAPRSGEHTQHGVALLVGLDCTVTAHASGASSARGRVVLVPQDVAHVVESEGTVVGALIDPDVYTAIGADARNNGGPKVLDGRPAKRILESATAHRAELERRDVLVGFAGDAIDILGNGRPKTTDRRVQRALEALRDMTADRSAIVSASSLSEAHLAALFVRDVGIAMRTYRLWQRMLIAVLALRRMDATSAAYEAGFADGAHFTRTCKRMLGYSPREMRRAMV